MTSNETKFVYYIGDEKTPYVSKINIPPQVITLGDFKATIKKPNYKFFFRSEDQDFGVVKEEITDDNSTLPFSENRVIAWLVAPAVESSSSQASLSNSSNSAQSGNQQPHQSNGRSFSPDSDLRSVSSNHKGRTSKHRHQHPSHYDSMSTLTSSDASTLYYDSRDDTSEYSTYTDTTASTHHRLRQMRHRYKKRRPRPASDTTSTYSSSITDSSMSLNILTVTLNMEKYNFLGISIVGQSNERGDGGIYIGSIMKGGAVAADARIEPGDMLLQVNDVNFENMSNEDAVRELRSLVHKPGPITLTVAKCWDPNPESAFFVPRDEPVRPIDPAAWANHINAVQGSLQGPTPPFSGARETSSDNLTSSLPESERYDKPLSIRTDMAEVVKMLKMPDSGLEVKTRMWLKITIPDAFIGSDLVDWLMQKVEGLGERRDARKYASSLLKMGYIKHTVKKITFSEQRYYIFGDYTGHNVINDFGNLSLGDSNSDRDSEMLGPLPVQTVWDAAGSSNHPYASYNSQPYRPQLAVHARPDTAGNGVPDYQDPPGSYQTPPPNYSSLSHGGDVEVASIYSYGGNSQRAPSVASFQQRTLASFGAGSGGSGSDQASESRFSVRSSRSVQSLSKQKSRSGSDKGLESNQSQVNVPFESPLPPYIPPKHPTLPQPSMTSHQRPLNAVSLDVSGSRQSFHRAMENPYFVGHL